MPGDEVVDEAIGSDAEEDAETDANTNCSEMPCRPEEFKLFEGFEDRGSGGGGGDTEKVVERGD